MYVFIPIKNVIKYLQSKLSAQTNTLRRVSADTICAFLCSSTGSEFVTLRTISNGGSNYSLQQIDFIPAPEFDLVEFDINENRIWGLWCNSQGIFECNCVCVLTRIQSGTEIFLYRGIQCIQFLITVNPNIGLGVRWFGNAA